MKTQEILTIIAMAALALCLVLAFSKGLTKNLKTKESMTHVCSLLVVIAVALLAVTQFLSEKENMEWEIGSVATASRPNGGARTKGGGNVSMGVEPNITCNANCPCDKNAPQYICSPYEWMTGDSNGITNISCKPCTDPDDKSCQCVDWSN